MRIVSAALKMISDMERIGDQALDIAEITEFVKLPGTSEKLCDGTQSGTVERNNCDLCRNHIDIMTETATEMVTKSIRSFVEKDLGMAGEVIAMDDIADSTFELIKDDLINALVADRVVDSAASDKAADGLPDRKSGEFFVDILMIAKYLERISDHAVNIAEWVIFSVEGKH